MEKKIYQPAEITIIELRERDIITTSKVVDDGPIEMPFVPRK